MKKIYPILMALGLTLGNPKFGLAASRENPKNVTIFKSTAIHYHDNGNETGKTICLYNKTGRSMGSWISVKESIGLRHSIYFYDPDGINSIEVAGEEFGLQYHVGANKEALILYMANYPSRDLKTYRKIRVTDELENVTVFRFSLESLINDPVSEKLITKPQTKVDGLGVVCR